MRAFFHFWLAAAIFLLLLAAGCRSTVVPVETAPLALPKDSGPILVLVDRLPGEKNFAEMRAAQVALALRHFSAHTSWEYVDAAPLEKVQSAAVVVYLGLDGDDALPAAALARLRRARRLVVSRYHLAQLRQSGVAFTHTSGGKDVKVSPGTLVRYKGRQFPTALPDFLQLRTRQQARVLADYLVPGGGAVPYIVQDGNALFINGEISFASSDVTWRGAMLAVCDVMAKFIDSEVSQGRPQAMLRLEDVSAVTPARQLERMVEYLAAARLPYGIGVIPDLRLPGRSVPPLRGNRKLVHVLRWAEEHGGTVILHGLHHCCSAHDAEGYEFWDYDHNSPLPNDSAEWMRSQVAAGLKQLTALGLHPQIWETPHYSASPADDQVVSEFFGVVWERRRPIGWLPWVLNQDQYGAMVLPEDLGYISLDGTRTVADQLARAKELLVCQSCLAAGFIHPNTARVQDVKKYVEGLRALGYVFVDPAQIVRQHNASRAEQLGK